MKTYKESVLPLKNQLYRLALRIVGREDRAQDVVQEVLIKVWEKREELTEVNNLSGYCVRMTRNLAIDKTRSRHHQSTTALHQVQHFVAPSPTPYEATAENDTFKVVRTIIKKLPPVQREIFELRDFEGLSYKEIAETTGQSMSQVKVYLSRARYKIKTELIAAYDNHR